MTPKEQFIAWLNDAYSTETGQIPVLQNHAEDAREYPEIYRRDMQHVEETRRQAALVKEMIMDLGGSISTAKTVIGKITGLGLSVSTEIFPDELIKNFLADYAAEHFEIASYRSLIATAKIIGEEQCVPVLEKILAEEIAMAEWIESYIPKATAASLKVTTNGTSASKTRSKKKRKASFFASPSTLTTLVGASAIGATAYWLLRSKKNHAASETAKQQLKSDHMTDGKKISLPETNLVETTVFTVEDFGSADIVDNRLGSRA